MFVKKRALMLGLEAVGRRPEVSHSHGYKEAFEKMFPMLVQDLTIEGLNDPEISDVMQHLREVHTLHAEPYFISALRVSVYAGSKLQCSWR